MSAHSVSATAERMLAGLAVGAGGKAQCSTCHDPVREGDVVGVYAYQMSDQADWTVPRLCCLNCRPVEVTTPTLGATEVVAHGRLTVTSDYATQESRLTLWGMETADYSPPEEGVEP